MWKYADLTQIHYLTERKKKRYWNNVRLSNYFKDFDQTIEVENQQEANTVCVSVPGAFNACKHSHLQTHNLINSHYEYQEEEKKKRIWVQASTITHWIKTLNANTICLPYCAVQFKTCKYEHLSSFLKGRHCDRLISWGYGQMLCLL